MLADNENSFGDEPTPEQLKRCELMGWHYEGDGLFTKMGSPEDPVLYGCFKDGRWERI